MITNTLAACVAIAMTHGAHPTSPSKQGQFDILSTVRASIKNSAGIDIARRQIQLDYVKLSESGADLKPKVNLSASETRFDRPTILDFGGNTVTALHDKLEILQAQLTQNIDILGQVRKTRDAARLQISADNANLDLLNLNRVLQTKLDYLEVLRAAHQVEVSTAALNRAKVQEETARKLYEGQVGQKVDYLRSQSATAQAEQDLVADKNALQVALATLANLSGLTLSASTALADLPTETINEKSSSFDALAKQFESLNIETLIKEGNQRRPEVLSASAELRGAEVGIKIAHFGTEPRFLVAVTGNQYPTTSLSYPRHASASLSISANWAIDDGGITRDEVQQAKIRRDQAQTRLDSTKSDIDLQVRTSYFDLLTALREISAAESNLRTAIVARDLAQVRYQSQVGLFLEVSDANAALVKAESQHVQALYGYYAALARFEAACGLPFEAQTNRLGDTPTLLR